MNRLSEETSPYLLQHAQNPVDWYPWGSEALERARREDKPILLSIGYAACHWCHVMEHESFENTETAALMNSLFVNIKVDREERPDLDSIYMQAVQAMTGHGGWPMTVFLTPAGEPFYGGTYFPPTDRHGIPAFTRVLGAIADAYRSDERAVTSTVAQLRQMFEAAARPAESGAALDPRALDLAYRGLAASFDMKHAGFGGAPKFPPSMGLEFLLRRWVRAREPFALEMVTRTFRAMASGGIYDQLGGGLHRYSVDAHWLVPHFEKMLYDNALFARLGVQLWQATQDNFVREVTERTIDWIAREMTSVDGGFFSSLDADSEGHEGTFYVWREEELDAILGQDAAIAKAYWGTVKEGNFEGANILHVPRTATAIGSRFGLSGEEVIAAIARARTAMYDTRARRVWPARDDKVLGGWNGLALRAVALAARAFDRADYRLLAVRNGEFLRSRMVHDGAVVRSVKDERAQTVGFLEDHAAVGLGFLELFSLTGHGAWFRDARAIADSMVARFYDAGRGMFFDTPTDHEALITRPRDVTDNALPSGNSLAADLLLAIDSLDGRPEFRAIAAGVVASGGDGIGRFPSAFGHLLGVADSLVHGRVEVAIVGDPEARSTLERVVAQAYVPGLAYVSVSPDASEVVALSRGKTPPEPHLARAFVCEGFTCAAPTADPSELRDQLLAAVDRAAKLSYGPT